VIAFFKSDVVHVLAVCFRQLCYVCLSFFVSAVDLPDTVARVKPSIVSVDTGFVMADSYHEVSC